MRRRKNQRIGQISKALEEKAKHRRAHLRKKKRALDTPAVKKSGDLSCQGASLVSEGYLLSGPQVLRFLAPR
jgi:hypothetical protein